MVICASTILFGCSKKQGCTDPQAKNFDSSNEENCCCEYSSSAVIWMNKAMAQNLANEGVKTLYYYVDGELVGSSGTVYYDNAPSCGATGSITVNKSLGGIKSKQFKFVVKDDQNEVLWDF